MPHLRDRQHGHSSDLFCALTHRRSGVTRQTGWKSPSTELPGILRNQVGPNWLLLLNASLTDAETWPATVTSYFMPPSKAWLASLRIVEPTLAK